MTSLSMECKTQPTNIWGMMIQITELTKKNSPLWGNLTTEQTTKIIRKEDDLLFGLNVSVNVWGHVSWPCLLEAVVIWPMCCHTGMPCIRHRTWPQTLSQYTGFFVDSEVISRRQPHYTTAVPRQLHTQYTDTSPTCPWKKEVWALES